MRTYALIAAASWRACRLALLAGATGCTFLVSFDTVDAGAELDGQTDGTFRRDAGHHTDGGRRVDATCPSCGRGDKDGQADRAVTHGDAPREALADVAGPVDVGNCATLAEGAQCTEPSVCQMAGTCQGGVCTPNPLTDGTACGAAPDACHDAPVCVGGACASPAAVADGKTCGAAPDACHDAPVCAHGACGAPKTLPESTNWDTKDSNARCCGGKPVKTTSSPNCGVCGWACAAGQPCGEVSGHYFCTGCTLDPQCASSCCSLSPSPGHCSPSNCAAKCQNPDVCTGGSHCVMGSGIDYCSY